MSAESSFWLNNFTLQGMTAKRGKAWHYMASEQGQEPNHYDGAVPVEDVERRLFGRMQVVTGSVKTQIKVNGKSVTMTDASRQAIVRPAGTFGAEDAGEILGLFKMGYKVHPYMEWLVQNVSTLLDNGLSVASAGLLKGGAVGWVQVEVDGDSIVTPSGFEFRPFLTAATSVDGSLATTYLRGAQAVVCDNTLSAALGSADGKVKYRHSKGSLARIGEAREALDLVFQTGEDFAKQVEELTNTSVSDSQWAAFLDAHVPTKNADGTPKAANGLTIATNKRNALTNLWTNDMRVAPWTGTAFGVVQAVNTWTHHIATVKNAGRQERNMLRMVEGEWDAIDNGTLATLNKVLTTA